MKKEQFIEQILNSTSGITKVNPNDDLIFKIEEKITAKNVVPMSTIGWVAASIVVLISLNIVLLHLSDHSNQSGTANLERVIYKNNQLYREL